MENLSIEKRPISKVLKNMEVGQVEKFPKIQYSSILSVKARTKIERDMEFSHSVKKDCIEVTRTV